MSPYCASSQRETRATGGWRRRGCWNAVPTSTPVRPYVLDLPSGPALGFKALHKAVIARDLDSIHFLMERGVDPMIEDARWGSSPRRWASFDDATEIMELLSKYEEEWQDDDDG